VRNFYYAMNESEPGSNLFYPKLVKLVYSVLPTPTLVYPTPCIMCGHYNLANLPWLSLPCGHGGHAGTCISNLSNVKCTLCRDTT
jgi:hypothetical protein